MKSKWVLIFITVLVSRFSCPAFAAFEDEVDFPADKIYRAARQVVERDYGLAKALDRKKQIDSKWNQDIVKRSRGMFKNILKQGVYRRYRFRVTVQDKGKVPVLRVKGTFQERSTGSDANLPWQTVKMMAADHRLEREIFFRILTQTEDNQKALVNSPNATNQPSLPQSSDSSSASQLPATVR